MFRSFPQVLPFRFLGGSSPDPPSPLEFCCPAHHGTFRVAVSHGAPELSFRCTLPTGGWSWKPVGLFSGNPLPLGTLRRPSPLSFFRVGLRESRIVPPPTIFWYSPLVKKSHTPSDLRFFPPLAFRKGIRVLAARPPHFFFRVVQKRQTTTNCFPEKAFPPYQILISALLIYEFRVEGLHSRPPPFLPSCW